MSKFLITSALPYVNGVKHLGNLAGSLLPGTTATGCSPDPPGPTSTR